MREDMGRLAEAASAMANKAAEEKDVEEALRCVTVCRGMVEAIDRQVRRALRRGERNKFERAVKAALQRVDPATRKKVVKLLDGKLGEWQDQRGRSGCRGSGPGRKRRSERAEADGIGSAAGSRRGRGEGDQAGGGGKPESDAARRRERGDSGQAGGVCQKSEPDGQAGTTGLRGSR